MRGARRALVPAALLACVRGVPWPGQPADVEQQQQAGAHSTRQLEFDPALEGHTEEVAFSLLDVGSGEDLSTATPGLRGEGRRLGEALGASTGRLRLHFQAHGERFDVEFHRVGGPVAARAKINAWKGGKWHSEPLEPSMIFESRETHAVLREAEGGLSGALLHRGQLYDVESDRDTGKLRVKQLGQDRQGDYGAISPAGRKNRSAPVLEEVSRRLVFAPDRINKWQCIPDGQSITRQITIGIAMGQAFRTQFTSRMLAARYLEDLVIKTNIVYKAQFNFVLAIKHLTLIEEDGEGAAAAPSWSSERCGLTIQDQLNKFIAWEAPEVGLWHLIDDCFGTSGTVGLAYVGTLCGGFNSWNNGWVNRGVSWVTKATWLTFAHEVGHNIGAGHSFEQGQGTTGGIMDYGDGTFGGAFQFNSQFRQAEVCAELREQMSCAHITEVQPACGNGLVEAGETCECPSGLSCRSCECCQLTNNAECTPDLPHSDSQCCTAGGQFKTPETVCSDQLGTRGYCVRGTCEVNNVCAKFSYQIGEYCGVSTQNECQYFCDGDGCGSRPVIKYTSGRVANQFVDGTPCGPDGAGACSGGVCNELGTWIEVETPIVWSHAVPDTAKETIPECTGYGSSAFLGIPNVVLPDSLDPYTLLSCRDACKAASVCRSFSYNAADKKCELWNPSKIDEDLINISGYDSYICDTWAAATWLTDADKWEHSVVATTDPPELGCANCPNGCNSDSCAPFTLVQCDQACKSKPDCNMIVHHAEAGTCEMWKTKNLKDLGKPKLGAADTYYFGCQGGHLCDCGGSNHSKVRVNCKCSDASETNECAAGKYCYDGACQEAPAARRLAQCEGVNVFDGTTTFYPYFGQVNAASLGQLSPLVLLLAVSMGLLPGVAGRATR